MQLWQLQLETSYYRKSLNLSVTQDIPRVLMKTDASIVQHEQHYSTIDLIFST